MANAKLVYERLTIEDILEVASPCFQEGSVDFPERQGYPILKSRLLTMLIRWVEKAHPDSVHELRALSLKCDHQPDCEEEYLCETLAAYILMPVQDFKARLEDIRTTWRSGCGWDPILWLAAIYIVEPWAVRFRISLLDEGYFDPYRAWNTEDPTDPCWYTLSTTLKRRGETPT